MSKITLLSLMLVTLSLHVAAETAATSDTQWLSYNGTVNGQRFSELTQINRSNASQLGEICRVKVDEGGAFQTGILQIDGVLYFTSESDTLAVDATNCAVRWRHHYVIEEPGGTPFQVNRGVASANGKLFRGTSDGRLLAIDMITGKTVWKFQIGDPSQGEFFSAAPQIYEGLVIIGAAGGDWGIRGRVMAFDTETGREIWRFYTVPRGDEPGADSWKNAPSARYGGGGTWTTYTLDMSAGELFVSVGNPTPDFMPAHRPGANLYTNSMVVLNAATGKLKWYHQLVSNDGRDLDLGAAPMLYFNSKGDRIVAFGGKDGYLYGVNRETHKLVYKTAVTTVTPPTRIPHTQSIHSCPGVVGGVEWNGPAFDRTHNAVVVGTVDWCNTLTTAASFEYKPGVFNFGGSFKLDEKRSGWIVSVDGDTGAPRWKFATQTPQVAGVTPTAGGVIFTGDVAGNFYALDAQTGKPLYQKATGGSLAGGVITYMRNNKQYVALTTGNVSRITFGAIGSPTLALYALGADNAVPRVAAAAAVADGPLKTPDPAHGAEVFGRICAACHGGRAEGAVGPALVGLAKRLDMAATIQWIKNPSAKMPKLYPAQLDAQAVSDVAAYLQGR